MVDIGFLDQLLDSMHEAVTKLEIAVKKNKTDEANKLRTFIFDLHRQMNGEFGGKNV